MHWIRPQNQPTMKETRKNKERKDKRKRMDDRVGTLMYTDMVDGWNHWIEDSLSFKIQQQRHKRL